MKKQSGITLVALIITIIVMVILAGVVIVTAVMDGGILDRAQTALRENERAEVEDIVITSYVYKTTASMDIIGQLDLEETAKAIYLNLTESNYKVKTTAGADAGRYEDIYTQGATSINLNVEGKQGTYTGIVEKNGLKDGMKIVKDTENEEVPPAEDDVVTSYSKTLNTNMNDYAEALAVAGMDIYDSTRKITYISGTSKIIVTLESGNTVNTYSVIYVSYTDAQGNFSKYAICNPEDPWTMEEQKNYLSYDYVPAGYWTKPTGEKYTSNTVGNEADIYGFITELPIFESDQEWQIDSENTTQEGLNLLSNVLKTADGTETLPEPPELPKVEEKKLTLSTNADQIFTNDFISIYGNMGSTQVANLAKLVYKFGEDSLEIVNSRTDSFGSTFLVVVNYYNNNNLINSYILRKTGGYSFKDDGTSDSCHGYPHYSTGWTDKTIVTGTCSGCNGNIYGVLPEAQFPEFVGDWKIDEANSNDYGKQYLTNVLVEK